MPPSDSRRLAQRWIPEFSLGQRRAWQVLARDIPMYFGKKLPLDSDSFVYVMVEMLWPDLGKASLVDVRMSEGKDTPARFFAYFTRDCAGFFRDVKQLDLLCLYLSDATTQQVEEQCKQNTLNLPFTLTWNKTCRLRYVEMGMASYSITFPTRMFP
jgi:hypothetical protein